MAANPTTPIETFTPLRRTVGDMLSSTSPAIRVPDYQRDYSWGKEQVTEFWADLEHFAGPNAASRPVGRVYFLGAAVLVNTGTYHLLLDGQQRLATATILLAALRDKIQEFNLTAAQQTQDYFICFHDHFSGNRVYRLELNVFDRAFFRDRIQSFPPLQTAVATKKSHRLIADAYTYFQNIISDRWDAAGGGKAGFDWAAHIALTLRENLALISVISNDEQSAGSIFTTLNDRGLGLSTVDLIRSHILQRANATERAEIVERWDKVFEACGTQLATETLIRFSWVSVHGDVKARALYKVVLESLADAGSALAYSRRLEEDAKIYRYIRDADTEDETLQHLWETLHILRSSSVYPLLISAHHTFSLDDQKRLAKALVALVFRRNVVSNLDRATMESFLYALAERVSGGESFDTVLQSLRTHSTTDAKFEADFLNLTFNANEHGIARYLLKQIEKSLALTDEHDVAGAMRVHLEHIYPQNPQVGLRWPTHEQNVSKLGNLTLLDRRLNETIKNSDFVTKRAAAYSGSALNLNAKLLAWNDWTPETIQERQASLAASAKDIWPTNLL
ncbi:MAG: DUF262 domain-containing protein [Acidobacteriota bacterium]